MIDDPDIFRAAKRPNGQPATMKQCEQPSACEPKMLLTSAVGVRREKAALSSGCKAHPAAAPAGSNRSSHGGNEMAEAFD